ncbi:N-acetylneuraminate synthase family protein [Kiloniella antarctica]|uniref:N-acetylneuraminate synthase family protein n=1 Tax=Kiloniella antarctica TaxID=1550907 RepID=A0ABW5BPQ6_9PROT
MDSIRIIAEIGINHSGSVQIARQLIDAAANAGVWGVKFQYRNLSNAYAEVEREIGDEIVLEEIHKNYLNPVQIENLSNYAKSINIAPGISFFSLEDTEDFSDKIECFEFFKVPSVEFSNLKLIRHLETFLKPCFISTGACEEVAIENILPQLDQEIWVPLHCVSNYPVNLSNSKLGYLSYLKENWDGDIGYSSHDEYWESCLLAIQLGAKVIERHITLDKAADGLDHTSSSTPDEFVKLVQFAENMSLLGAGYGPRVPNQGELLNLQNLGRSYYVKSDVEEGAILRPENVLLRSPRTGLGQEEAQHIFGMPAIRHIKAGSVLDRSVVEAPAVVSEKVLQFACDNSISLPVRFHDLNKIETLYPIGRYEFHLSFGDMEHVINCSSFSPKNKYSIHLPDYISSTQLVDTFSSDESQREASIKTLDRTVDFSKALQDHTGNEVLVVGSFSVVNTTLQEFYHLHSELFQGYRDQGVVIIPQWLPPIAWYFGGAVRLKAMNNISDIEYLKSLSIPICMDVCHLAMGDTVFDFKAKDVIQKLESNIRHIHIADAIGYDGEGVALGEGDLKNQEAIDAVMKFQCAKVIEVWQGHLNHGAGFANALNSLYERYNGK